MTKPVTATALPLTISLFGSFEVKLGNKPVTAFRSNKVRALLAYLVLTRPQPILRTTLIDFFWHDYATASARVNLRQVLANLREALAPSMLLQIEHHTVQLAVDSPLFWCDALHFAELVETCRQHAHVSLRHCAACQERLRQAAQLYKGAFLENFPEVDSAPFTAWRRTQRHHFAALFADVQAALAHEATAPGNLTAPLTSLVGRTAELPQLAAKLLHPVYRWLTLVGPGGIGKTRLALVLGKHLQSHFPDGVWLVELAALPSASSALSSPPKTPLVSEMADGDRQQERLYNRIAMTISAALGLKLEGKQHPTEELSVYLRNKAALLILDNIEHVSAGADLILKLLQGAPHLRILVTSRHRLNFQSQLVYRVDGLSVPTVSEQRTLPVEELLAHYSSLQLFVERAHNAHADLVLNATNIDAIVHICRLVEGIPWAIELAAALLHTQSPVAILQALQTNYTVLQAELYDLPARQHSAYAVFLSSWHLLTAGEAQILARCAVFRGGFTGVAAQVIAGATPTDLQMLMQKSLLHVTAAERYTMHELVRQFAAEQFVRQGEAVRPIYDRYAAYYTSFLANWHLSATADHTWQATIQPELENIEAAWFWALEQANVALLTEALAGLSHFYRLSGLYYAAQATLARSVAHLRPLLVDPHAPPLAMQQLFAQLLLHLSICYNALAQSEQTIQVGEELVEWAVRLGNPQLAVEAYRELSNAAWVQGDYRRQQLLLEQAIHLAQQQGLRTEEAQCLSSLGLNAQARHDYPAALAHLQRGLALAQQTDKRDLMVMLLNNLGTVYRDLGDFGQAAHCFQQNLALMRQIDQKNQIALATANLGTLWLLLGDFAQALTCLREGQQLFAAQGAKRLEAELLALLALLFEQTGDLATAAAYCTQTLALAGPNNYYHPHREAWITLGHVHLRQGELAAARTAYEHAHTLSQSADIPAELVQGQACLAQVLIAQGEKAQALPLVEQVLQRFVTVHFDPFQSPQRILLACYTVLAAAHDPRAEEILHQAWCLVQHQAAKISDPRLRDSFLANVPVNRTVRALVAQGG